MHKLWGGIRANADFFTSYLVVKILHVGVSPGASVLVGFFIGRVYDSCAQKSPLCGIVLCYCIRMSMQEIIESKSRAPSSVT